MTTPSNNNKTTLEISGDTLIGLLFSLPWLNILADAWKFGRKLWHGMADEGMYEVLDYESTLEILDVEGRQAQFEKREKVRYLQHNILAYQDQAWGDGEILIDYQCSPGTVVDQYRPGRKTYVLISLREVKARHDVDEFNITWRMRDGFLRQLEQWETEVRHRTKQLRVAAIFPADRPPTRVWLVEYLRRRTRPLPQNHVQRLPDSRWMVTWAIQRPRLHEEYILRWEW